MSRGLRRTDRLELLLRTLEDAQPGLHCEGDSAGTKTQFGSRSPIHADESRSLWVQGSYRELEKALRRLRSISPALRESVWIYYVHQPTRNNLRYLKAYRRLATLHEKRAKDGLALLAICMPDAIRVPPEISENGALGFEPPRK